MLFGTRSQLVASLPRIQEEILWLIEQSDGTKGTRDWMDGWTDGRTKGFGLVELCLWAIIIILLNPSLLWTSHENKRNNGFLVNICGHPILCAWPPTKWLNGTGRCVELILLPIGESCQTSVHFVLCWLDLAPHTIYGVRRQVLCKFVPYIYSNFC